MGPASSSRFSRARSSSTAARARQLGERAIDLSLAGRQLVGEGSRGDQLVDGCGTGLHLLGLVAGALDRAPRIREPLAEAGRRLADLHHRLRGRVLGLDHFLLGAEALDPVAEILLALNERLLLSVQLLDLGVERAQLLLHLRLARECDAGQVLPGQRQLPDGPGSTSVTSCSRHLLAVISTRFFAVTTSAVPTLTCCRSVSCCSYE